MNLSLYETRVIGVLLEKEVTTPDQYPLSLNALTNACNQKSSRDPVMSLEEAEVQETLDELVKKRLVSEVVVGSRVSKYKHRFCNTEFSELHLQSKELGCICVLFLRGPQTPGELRSRTNRLCQFSDVSEVDATLKDLAEKEGGALVVQLPREPGKREARYTHLFSGDSESVISEYASNAAVAAPSQGAVRSSARNEEHEQRIAALEEQVVEMKKELDWFKDQWEELNS